MNTGCKKDDDENDSENPNVEFIDVTDIVADATGKEGGTDEVEFDINKDGINDFALYSDNYSDGEFTLIHALTEGSSVAVKTIIVPSDEEINFALELTNGQDIKGLNFNSNEGGYGHTSALYDYEGITFSEGIHGKGDKLIGVKFRIGTAIHYGWLKVNVDANALKITLKEVAYNKVAGETLKAGEK